MLPTTIFVSLLFKSGPSNTSESTAPFQDDTVLSSLGKEFSEKLGVQMVGRDARTLRLISLLSFSTCP